MWRGGLARSPQAGGKRSGRAAPVEAPVRRSFVLATVSALAASILLSSPAGAVVRLEYTAPAQFYRYEKDVACPGLALELTERDDHNELSDT